jgi:transcriptional regulator with XRE-family HTH domain
MRSTLGERFKILLLDAGLTPETAGKELHVSPRTVRYWISGKVLVPYAAFRLIRILSSLSHESQVERRSFTRADVDAFVAIAWF